MSNPTLIQKYKAKPKNVKFSEHATAHVTVFIEPNHSLGMVLSEGYFNFVWRSIPNKARVEIIHERGDFELELRITQSSEKGVKYKILHKHIFNETPDAENTELPRVEYVIEDKWRVLDKDGRVIEVGFETKEQAQEVLDSIIEE